MRNQAAIGTGSGSDSGSVLSKKAAMASAGTLQPIVEWGLRRLQQASMSSITACLAESLVEKLRLQCISLSVIRSESDQPATMRVFGSMTGERYSRRPSPGHRCVMSPASL